MTDSFIADRVPTRIGGVEWMLDTRQSIDKTIATVGEWEHYSTEACRRYVPVGGTALDVGANIGYFTVLLARIVGPTGSVLAFEPMEEPFDVLREHVRRNTLANVTTHRVALDARDGEGENDVRFNYSWTAPGVTIAQRSGRAPFRALDSLVRECPLARLDFIKVDTDGYEARFVDGADATLRRFRPVLLIEVCGYTLRHVAGRPPFAGRADPEYAREVVEMLRGLVAQGYRVLHEATRAEMTPEAAAEVVDLTRTGYNAILLPPGVA